MTAFGLGLLFGAVAAHLLTRYAQRHQAEQGSQEPDGLTDHDRDELADVFAQHTQAVNRQVSEFADQLAGGDEVLRARLRQFEAGERP